VPAYTAPTAPCRSEPRSRTAAQRPQPEQENGTPFAGEASSHKKIGACAHSDITVFSFHPVKIITTGEGGIALTDDPELAGRMARLRNHGITRDPAEMTHEADGPWYYLQSRTRDLHDPDDFTDTPAGREKLDGVCMQFMAIGEALKKVDRITEGQLLARFPEVDWKGAMGFRDLIAHQYFDN
jgi:hypothetical protein